jgi:hypothetical protein
MDVPKDCAPSSLVWFENPNSFDRVWPESLYYSLRLGFVFRGFLKPFGKLCGVTSNRKVQVLERPTAAGMNPNQAIDKMVEGAPQTVHSVSSDKGYPIGDGEFIGKIPNALLGLRIVLGSNYVSVLKESVPFGLKIKDVLIGPFNFGA